MAILQIRSEPGLPEPQRAYRMWCPGCHLMHRVVDGPNGWTWDGNETAPTFSPSILVQWQITGRREERCHSFVRAGQWEFLSDCTHALAGQTVPMVPIPADEAED